MYMYSVPYYMYPVQKLQIWNWKCRTFTRKLNIPKTLVNYTCLT